MFGILLGVLVSFMFVMVAYEQRLEGTLLHEYQVYVYLGLVLLCGIEKGILGQ